MIWICQMSNKRRFDLDSSWLPRLTARSKPWRRDDLMANLNWKVLTKKRPGVTQGLPPGTEDLAWVTNTVTLIHCESRFALGGRKGSEAVADSSLIISAESIRRALRHDWETPAASDLNLVPVVFAPV